MKPVLLGLTLGLFAFSALLITWSPGVALAVVSRHTPTYWTKA